MQKVKVKNVITIYAAFVFLVAAFVMLFSMPGAMGKDTFFSFDNFNFFTLVNAGKALFRFFHMTVAGYVFWVLALVGAILHIAAFIVSVFRHDGAGVRITIAATIGGILFLILYVFVVCPNYYKCYGKTFWAMNPGYDLRVGLPWGWFQYAIEAWRERYVSAGWAIYAIVVVLLSVAAYLALILCVLVDVMILPAVRSKKAIPGPVKESEKRSTDGVTSDELLSIIDREVEVALDKPEIRQRVVGMVNPNLPPHEKIVRIPFQVRMHTCSDEMKSNYNVLKSEIMSYGVHSRISNKGDTFRLHAVTYVRIAVAGKGLKLYLRLNPADYADSTIPFQDVSSQRVYKDIPFAFRVKSELSLRRAKDLIADVMAEAGFEQKRVVYKDWIADIPESGDDSLPEDDDE